MESLTFGTAGGELVAGDWRALKASFGARYPAVERPPVRHLVRFSGRQVHGFACTERVGGVVVHPAEVVLGLKAWDDAYEGVLPEGNVPWVLFDAEKIVRMMLRQSGLALEILASPWASGEALVSGGMDAQWVVRAAITREIVLHYRDVTRPGVAWLVQAGEVGEVGSDKIRLQELFRNLLTGCVLGQQGHVSLHLDDLLDFEVARGVREPLGEVVSGGASEDSGAVRELGRQAARLQGLLEVEQARVLPERPSDYEGLHGWLIAERLAAREQAGRRNAQ